MATASNAARRRYPSDLTEAQWQTLADLLVDRPHRHSTRATSLRDVADAVNYRWHTGCSWRMLPHDFPPWSTVYAHFRRWRQRRLLSGVRAIALSPQRTGGRMGGTP